MADEHRPLVIGVGNRLRGDDGIGPEVVDLLDATHGDVLDTAVAAGDLSDLAMGWAPDQTVVIVDATVSGRAPGTITVLDAAAATAALPDQPLSSHGVGLGDAIALARAIGRPPLALTVVAIEGSSFGHGQPLTEAVGAAAPVAADQILDLLAP